MARPRYHPTSALDWFIHSEVAGSAALLACTVAAMVWANSPWADQYFRLAHTQIAISVGESRLALSLQHWINDGLMVVFFFVIGLEIKRELTAGHLSSVRQAILPVAAAVGGMVVPAVIYAALNAHGPGARGWGIPMATDIAFALGVLALVGRQVPIGLKVFLTALAIADDLGAVLVIALFYTAEIRWAGLAAALPFLILLGLVIRAGIRLPVVYAVLVIGVWLAVFTSGVHATVAGILMAMLVPVRPRLNPQQFFATVSDELDALRAAGLTRDSVLADEAQLDALVALDDAATEMRPPGLTLERFFHPLQSLLILPLFAFVNAGVSLGGKAPAMLGDPVALGVVAGLVLGKVVGISLASWLAVRSGSARLPDGVSWPQLVGAGLLGGVGFTMSLFVADLAFDAEALLYAAKLGILVGSLIAGVAGYLVLRTALATTVPRA
ncbi:MAG: Na+/H+ antiporter NhaA [Candidatus Rokubacteria bacterium]|nr:Na+/H+ antiporter NhaA [Candidatus Rokubacteria bacterium]